MHNADEIDGTTESLSPVPAVASNSGTNRVVITPAMVASVGQGVPQVSPIQTQQQTANSAANIISDHTQNVAVLFPEKECSKRPTGEFQT